MNLTISSESKSNMKSLTEKIAAVYQILSDAHKVSPWTQEQIENDLRSKDVDYFFAYDQEKIIGFLSLQQLVGELEITNIAVLKTYQGKGVGSHLLTHLVDYNLPIFLEVRESNLAAQALYQKYDFKVVGHRRDYYRNPTEGALLMKREGENER
ncbi:ribosomal protein S18-alanine N-acetyltransferase [Streptococcus uberis]